MKQCPQCNFSCNDNDIVCKNCGHLFSAANFPDDEAPQSQEQQPYAPQQPDQQPHQQTPYQQAPYQPPNQPPLQYPQPITRKTGGLTIAGFVLSLCSIVFSIFCSGTGILFAIPGLIMSIVSNGRIRRRGEQGKGFAIAGIICSILGIVIGIAMICYIIYFFSTSEGQHFLKEYVNTIQQQYNSASSQ